MSHSKWKNSWDPGDAHVVPLDRCGRVILYIYPLIDYLRKNGGEKKNLVAEMTTVMK